MADFLKDYEPVEDRLRAFWSDCPEGRVATDLIYHGGGDYIVRASVWKHAGLLYEDGSFGPRPADATGLAHDSVEQLPPNMKNSALEVAETSAIGRALANLGYAPKGKRPSREEMQKASGAEAGGSQQPAQDPAPGITSTDGEAVGEEPGEQPNSPGSTKDAPGPPHYSLDPSVCDHRRTTGSRMLLSPRKSPRGPVCPRCGLSYITVTESTSADLGSA